VDCNDHGEDIGSSTLACCGRGDPALPVPLDSRTATHSYVRVLTCVCTRVPHSLPHALHTLIRMCTHSQSCTLSLAHVRKHANHSLAHVRKHANHSRAYPLTTTHMITHSTHAQSRTYPLITTRVLTHSTHTHTHTHTHH
jgi:hypothetical protein